MVKDFTFRLPVGKNEASSSVVTGALSATPHSAAGG